MDSRLKRELSDLNNIIIPSLLSIRNSINELNDKLSNFEINYNQKIDSKLNQNNLVNNSTELHDIDIPENNEVINKNDIEEINTTKSDSEALTEAHKWLKDLENVEEKSNIKSQEFLDVNYREYDVNKDPYMIDLDKPIGSTILMKKFIETSHNDEIFYETFTTQWNKTKKQRIETLLSTINLFVVDIKSLKHDECKVTTLEDAELALNKLKKLEIMKNEIINLCDNQKEFKNLLTKDTVDDYYNYYNIVNELTENLLKILNNAAQCEFKNATDIFKLFNSMLEIQELEMFTISSVDLTTFETIPLSGENLRKYQNSAIKYYKKDLKNAFEYRSKHVNIKEAA
jgi:hypothetical protein